MNERLDDLMYASGLTAQGCWDEMDEYAKQAIEKFAELIIEECISSVGSQADKAYLRKRFDLPVESDIVYPATEESWSVKSQYNREYNFPK
jgi:hypothetical protein